MTISTFFTLMLAIMLEVIVTSFLQRTEQFTRLWPSVATLLCYSCSFYVLTLVLRTMPLGIAYAIWGGLGMVLVATVGYFLFGQKLDLPALLGLGLIIAGVLVINLFSNTASH